VGVCVRDGGVGGKNRAPPMKGIAVHFLFVSCKDVDIDRLRHTTGKREARSLP